MQGKGRPNGKVKAPIDELYLDTSCAVLWIKEADAGKATGWACLGIVVPTGTTATRVSAPVRPRLEGIPSSSQRPAAGSPFPSVGPRINP